MSGLLSNPVDLPSAAPECSCLRFAGARTEPENEDSPLIRAARLDPRAYARLYRLHYTAVAGYLLRRCGDADLAEDLAAETFISAWRALPRYRQTAAPFRAWLLRIATNHANARARRDRARSRAESRASAPSRGTGADRDDVEALRAALRTLPERDQSVIALVHLESMSIDAAAEVLGVRPGTVKSRLHRARAALRVELQRLGALP